MLDAHYFNSWEYVSYGSWMIIISGIIGPIYTRDG